MLSLIRILLNEPNKIKYAYLNFLTLHIWQIIIKETDLGRM